MSPRGRGRGGHPTSLGSTGGKCRHGADRERVDSKGLSMGSDEPWQRDNIKAAEFHIPPSYPGQVRTAANPVCPEKLELIALARS